MKMYSYETTYKINGELKREYLYSTSIASLIDKLATAMDI